MCKHNADGSETTQANRIYGLMGICRELREMGFVLPSANSLKPRHVTALVSSWKGRGLSEATIKNRMSWLRWWATKTNRRPAVPKANAALGIADTKAFKGRRAAATSRDRLANLPERMQLAIRLQMAFGMRLEECLKVKVAIADKGTILALKDSWCKGGRARSIPIVHARQRDLVDEVHRVCGNESLVPAGMKYIRYRKQVEKAALKAGVTNMHKHRHWYACWRYETLTGRKAPSEGGPTHDRLTPAERRPLDEARLAISRELGHNRIEVTDAYLGYRWPERGAS